MSLAFPAGPRRYLIYLSNPLGGKARSFCVMSVLTPTDASLTAAELPAVSLPAVSPRWIAGTVFRPLTGATGRR